MTALEALALTIDRRGHLAGRCGHGNWIVGWSNRTQHTCDVPDCDREGAPCSKPCAIVRRTLRASQEALPAALQAAQPAEGG